MYRDLAARYAEPWRAYHVMKHIGHCLREFDRERRLSDDGDAVQAAIWFHDAVYFPGRPDNEAESAALAQAVLEAGGVALARRRRIAELILATAHDVPPGTPDARLLTDIDLAILAAEPAAYDEYEGAIRREYAALSDLEFAAGRSDFLRRFLARPRLYATDAFHQRYEAAARSNLVRALAALAPPADPA